MISGSSIMQNTLQDAPAITETIRYTYDRQGNLLSDDKAVYTYDGFHRLSEIRCSDGSYQKNRYDAEELRHEMEENGALVKFLFNENREIEAEEQSDGTIIRYIRGLGILSSDSEKAKTYFDKATGEVKEKKKSQNRHQSLKSVRKSINKIMDLVRCNVTDPAQCKWITLTYADVMTDCI